MMNYLSLELISDIFITALLGVMITYSILLNRRLKKLRGNKNDVDNAIQQFDNAVSRAESSILNLKSLSETAEGSLLESIQQAQVLRDELAFMNERGEDIANKMEQKISESRKKAAPTEVADKAPIDNKDFETKFMKMLDKNNDENELEVINQDYRARPRTSKTEEALKQALRAAR
jgi:uncharacterized protein DUF6468